MTDSSAELDLMSSIASLIDRAGSMRDQLAADDVVAAKQIAGWPETQAVNAAAGVAARTNRYLHYDDDAVDDHWGRRLTRSTLRALGVLAMLRRPEVPAQFPADLAAYLTGPPIQSERLVVIDARMPMQGSHEICGWQLTEPTAADLDAMVPLPSSSLFAADPWDPALRLGGCCVLRQGSDDLEARNPSMWGTALQSLFEPELVIPAWQPLLLLNLAQSERVIIAAEYEIEPGRMVERVRGTGLDLMPATSDGIDEWEEPGWGPCRLDEEELADVLTFTGIMSPLLQQWLTGENLANNPQPKALKKASERLRRSAHRFLGLGSRLGSDGDVLYARDRAEIIFWYVSALENLMITDSSDGELSRRVSQRTAVLIGTDDNERLEIRRAITQAYGIRSKVAHGDVPPETHLQTLPKQLHGYLRRAFRDLIILGPLFDVAAVCDDALLSAAVREQFIADPVGQVIDRLPEEPGMAARRRR
ncbi:hypothetical protein ACFPIJ_11895 [Dactylosporangium cerinum]|uniref:Apea-like HEPN domain-containing protein n=1 Tax=Dactylosporangium cerinum TaxID=1434730 RepID=A0ABV9VQW5_9ACTN